MKNPDTPFFGKQQDEKKEIKFTFADAHAGRVYEARKNGPSLIALDYGRKTETGTRSPQN